MYCWGSTSPAYSSGILGTGRSKSTIYVCSDSLLLNLGPTTYTQQGHIVDNNSKEQIVTSHVYSINMRHVTTYPDMGHTQSQQF